MTSTITLYVPASWPLAYNLFQDVGSTGFQHAYDCIQSGADLDGTVSAVLSQGYVKVGIVSRRVINNWSIFAPAPWNLSVRGNKLVVSFEPSPELVETSPEPAKSVTPSPEPVKSVTPSQKPAKHHRKPAKDATPSPPATPKQKPVYFDWVSISATTHDFQIADPTPIPATEPSNAKMAWYPRLGQAPLVSFAVIPTQLLRIVFTAQTGGFGENIPLDAEGIAFLVAIIAILRWRRKREIDAADHAWVSTRRLCFVVAGLSIIQLTHDIASQFVSSYWVLDVISLTQPVIICAAALAILRQRVGKAGTVTAFFVAALIILNVIYNQLFFVLRDNRLPFIPFNISGLEAVLNLGLSFLGWTIILDGISSLRKPASRPARGPLPFLLAAGTLVLLSNLAALRLRTELGAWVATSFPAYSLLYIGGCLIIFGSLLLVAKGDRPVPLLLEGNDKLLLAVTIGYGMLVTGPQWYLGFRVGVVAILGFITTIVVLKISTRHSLIRPASQELENATSSDLHLLQEKLVGNQKRLDEVKKDLKSFEGVPLTGEQLKRRECLEKEEDRLRCWPALEDPPNPTLSTRLNTRLRSLFGIQEERSEEHRASFPEPAGPVDVALALGPACEPESNMRRAFLPAFALALVPACYFAWREVAAGVPLVITLQNYLDLVPALAEQLTFWLFPLLVLAVAWSSLAGRRGSGRGIQVWLFVSLPLAFHILINQVLNQSATLTSVLQSMLLLITLLILGLLIDLSTLREYRTDVTFFRQIQNYVRLNRVVATVSLLIPLATAGLTIFTQVENGVLHQKPPAVQGSQANKTGPPAPTPSPSPSVTAHAEKKK